jgi:selenocysteine lyase/cysteine desulfurase
VVQGRASAQITSGLVDQGVMASSGNFYAQRVLAATGVDVEDGVVRVSWVHYTSPADIDHLLRSLDQVLAHTPT